MKQFINQTSKALPVKMDNVDTDQIIPGQYLTVKCVEEGLRNYLFYNLKQDPDFVLNKEEHKDAKFIVAGDNFGCGSSREHAPWAILDYGFTAVVASSFADIFRSNSLKNGLLLVQIKPEELQHIHEEIAKNPQIKITISLEEKTVRLEDGNVYTFELERFRRKCILEGMDDLDYILSFEDKIGEYEEKTPVRGY